MPKFYVTSGELQVVLDRPSPKEAALDAFKTIAEKDDICLGLIVQVSEMGMDMHEDDEEDDRFFSTDLLLEEAGLLGEFESPDSPV